MLSADIMDGPVSEVNVNDYLKVEIDKAENNGIPTTKVSKNDLSDNSDGVNTDQTNGATDAIFAEENTLVSEDNVIDEKKVVNNKNGGETENLLVREEETAFRKLIKGYQDDEDEVPDQVSEENDNCSSVKESETKDIPVSTLNIESSVNAISVQDVAIISEAVNRVQNNLNDEEDKVIENNDIFSTFNSNETLENDEEESTLIIKPSENPTILVEKPDGETHFRIRARPPLRSKKLNSSFSVKSEPSSPSGLVFNKLYKPEGKFSLYESDSRKRPRGDITPENNATKKACKQSRFGNVFSWLSADSEIIDCDLMPLASATEPLSTDKRSCTIM